MNLKKYSILAIDDDPDVLTAVRLLLKPEVKEIVTEKNPENIPALLSKQTFDLVLLDMNFKASINTGNEGIFWLKRVKELQPALAVIMIRANHQQQNLILYFSIQVSQQQTETCVE